MTNPLAPTVIDESMRKQAFSISRSARLQLCSHQRTYMQYRSYMHSGHVIVIGVVSTEMVVNS